MYVHIHRLAAGFGVCLALGLLAPEAGAQSRSRGGARVSATRGLSSRSAAPRSFRSAPRVSRGRRTGVRGGSRGGSGGGSSRGFGRPSGSSTRSNRGTGSASSLQDLLNGGLRGGGSSRGYGGYGGLGNGIADALYGYNNDRYGYQHSGEKYRADAYRDVAIINAIAGTIGLLVTTSTCANGPYATAAPARTVAAPAHTVTAPGYYSTRIAPAGHYAPQKVLAKEGYYEQQQVWVPPIYSRTTGEQIGGGFHETRTHWVPEIYEYRDVRVQR